MPSWKRRIYNKIIRQDATVEKLNHKIAKLARQQKQSTTLLGWYRNAFERIHRFDYGSITPPIQAWTERWNSGRRRVLMFATLDYAGSLHDWAEAVNARTDWAARVVVIYPHPLGYPTDVAYGTAETIPPRFHDLAAEADVIQIKDEVGFMNGSNLLPQDLLTRHGKPMITTQCGTKARQSEDNAEYQRYVKDHAAAICLTPDLYFDWLDHGFFVPHAVAVEKIPTTWQDSSVVAHSPSDPKKKGTDGFRVAFDALAGEMSVELDLITGVSHEECLRRKSAAGLFFDQGGVDPQTGQPIGWYGNSALEAAARGIPTIAHLSEQALERAAKAGHDIRERAGILNTTTDVDGFLATMRSYFALDPAGRAEMSRAARRWVEEFHANQVVGPQLAAVYDAVV